ncbi:uncharacterized protein MKK02DRAFT_44951 [Dioszegia hungarica]|uniref:Large ribosomal subunit protein bL33m n=1 Tax=Dioszegia hungarica TaxID=4972 RepID=A0AA38H9V1_9TREE|nr:uncharacterized protein MKK02DRAFT_44951 [Dioszegia hungarica]KAI9636246.1 hypothetical protein MKK02DRAFT_44951 [Dioszegia hungarica]
MAPKAKARRILIRLVSTALTGFFYTTTRARLGEKLAMMKYDPMVKKHVLFTEAKIK